MVLAVFFAYIGGAIYGLTTLQEGLQRRKLSRADSYSIEFYDREDFYFREFPYRMQVMLCEEQFYFVYAKHTHLLFNLLPCLFFNTKWSATATRLEKFCYCSTVYITPNGSTFNFALTDDKFLFMIYRTRNVWLELKKRMFVPVFTFKLLICSLLTLFYLAKTHLRLLKLLLYKRKTVGLVQQALPHLASRSCVSCRQNHVYKC